MEADRGVDFDLRVPGSMIHVAGSRLLSLCGVWVVRVGGDDGEPTLICVAPWSEFPIVSSYSHYPHGGAGGWKRTGGSISP